MRCGVVVSRYKGPVLGGAPGLAEPPPLPSMPAVPPPLPLSMESAGTVYGGPAPAMAASGGGTVYGGTVYGPGPAPVTAAVPVQGPFEIGKILSETFAVYFANFIPFVLLTGLALSPLYLLQAYVTGAGEGSTLAAVSAIPLMFAAILCPQIATAAITYGVFQQMRGRETSIGDCLRRGLSSLGPVLGLAILQAFGIGFGLIACVVPGILLMVRWAVCIPAAVEERPGVGGALDRSTYLTEGYRGQIFGVLFVLGVLNIGSLMVVVMATGGDQVLQLVLSGIKDLLTVGLSATAASVMYYRLRSAKESIDVDQISSVFA
jgi:hypothetical protein